MISDHLQQTLAAIRAHLSAPNPELKSEIDKALADVNENPSDRAKEQHLQDLLRQLPNADEKVELD